VQVLKPFEYIITIAEFESISAAAEQLHIAQSALSRYLLKLEKELGVELFDRSTLPLKLTEAGRCYVEAGQRLLDTAHQMEKRLEDIRCNRSREIRVGTGPSRAPILFPLILEAFRLRQADARIRIEECRTAELSDRLEKGQLDLVISLLDETTSGFGMEELFEETVLLAVPKRLESSVERALTPDGRVRVDALTVPIISLHPGQQLRNALDILSGGTQPPICHCEYVSSAMALVRSGFGVTLAPFYWKIAEADQDSIRFYPVAVPERLPQSEQNKLMAVMRRRICIFYRKEQFLSLAERDFIRSAQEACRAFNAEMR